MHIYIYTIFNILALKLFLGTDKAYLWLLANHVYEVQLLIFCVCVY